MKEDKKRSLNPFVDEFYKNNCRAKVEYQGMYAFPGTEPGQIIWTAWSGEEYVEALLKQLETGIAQKILVCLADGNCLKILQALIHKTLAQQSVSAADLAAVSGTDLEEITDALLAKNLRMVLRSSVRISFKRDSIPMKQPFV